MAVQIPEELRNPEFRFIMVAPKGKNPIEQDWQGTRNYRFDDPELLGWLQQGGNYGIVCGPGGLRVIDFDDESKLYGLGIYKKLPKTYTVSSRENRAHKYIICPELEQKLIFYHPEEIDPKTGKLMHLGEIQGPGTQVVGPRSIHPDTRMPYAVMDPAPIARLSKAELMEIMAGVSFDSKPPNGNAARLEANAARLDGIVKKARLSRTESDETRTWRYAEAALEGEIEKVRNAPEGSRNDQLFKSAAALGEFVAAGVLSEAEVVRALEAVAEDGEPDKIPRTIMSGIEAGARHPREIPAPATKPAPNPEELEETFTNDPKGSLKNPAFLGELAVLRLLDPIEYDLLKERIASAKALKGVSKKTIDALVEKHRPNPEVDTCNDDREESIYPDDILTEANQILDAGRGFEYVYEVWQRRHHGDENLGKGLLLSIGAQSCISSKGVHIHACGPRGSGKSDGTEKASEAIPPSYLLVGSASPKALYYLGERLPAGSIVYLDDIGWNDQAAQMFKTCTTFYREGATHTVVVDQEIRQFKTAPRIIFWLTTADDQTDEQIRDRLLRIDTTEDPKHTKAVIDFIFNQRKNGAASFDPRELAVCQAIIYLLKQVFADVIIPFTDNIRFEGDPRGATIFADLVSSFAIWRHRIRKHDSNGAVIACYEDYKDAETFFNAIKGHGDTKYTPRELRVLQAIKDLHGEATREMVGKKTGLSKGDLSDILNGRSRDGQAKYGLFHKCPALTEDEEGTSIQLDDAQKTRTSSKKKILRLPEDYDTLSAYGKTVYLADENDIKRTCSASSERFGTGSEIKNKFGNDIVRKFVEYNNIRERYTNEHHPLWVAPNFEIKNLSFSTRPKNAELPNSEAGVTGSTFRTNVEPMSNQTQTKQKDIDSEPTNSDKIRAASISEYGLSGWVDPRKIANHLKLPLGEVEEWLRANYVVYDRPGGGVGYRQRRAGEAIG